jgi:hypothetical protein
LPNDQRQQDRQQDQAGPKEIPFPHGSYLNYRALLTPPLADRALELRKISLNDRQIEGAQDAGVSFALEQEFKDFSISVSTETRPPVNFCQYSGVTVTECWVVAALSTVTW